MRLPIFCLSLISASMFWMVSSPWWIIILSFLIAVFIALIYLVLNNLIPINAKTSAGMLIAIHCTYETAFKASNTHSYALQSLVWIAKTCCGSFDNCSWDGGLDWTSRSTNEDTCWKPLHCYWRNTTYTAISGYNKYCGMSKISFGTHLFWGFSNCLKSSL